MKWLRKLFRKKLFSETNMRVANNGRYIISIISHYSDGDIKKVEFIGDCTVWYEYPSFHRCNVLTETALNEIYERHRYHCDIK